MFKAILGIYIKTRFFNYSVKAFILTYILKFTLIIPASRAVVKRMTTNGPMKNPRNQ